MQNATPEQPTTGGAARHGLAPVNGLQLYYEIHGAGRPLILLHGGFGASDMFAPIVPQLAAGRQVVAVDMQGHGRTADVDRPLTPEGMADDIALLAQRLGFDQADVLGYSLGAGVAIQVAVRHPQMLRKLVVVSFPYKRSGWYPEVRNGMDQVGAQSAEMMKQSPPYQLYARVAPRPEDWPVLGRKTGEYVQRDFDWSREVAAIEAPTLVVAGDADSFAPTHAAEFFSLLGGGKEDAGWDRSRMPRSRLAILPGTTHYDIFASPLLPAVVVPFLDAP